jgi:hypothetical protein
MNRVRLHQVRVEVISFLFVSGSCQLLVVLSKFYYGRYLFSKK